MKPLNDKIQRRKLNYITSHDAPYRKYMFRFYYHLFGSVIDSYGILVKNGV